MNRKIMNIDIRSKEFNHNASCYLSQEKVFLIFSKFAMLDKKIFSQKSVRISTVLTYCRQIKEIWTSGLFLFVVHSVVKFLFQILFSSIFDLTSFFPSEFTEANFEKWISSVESWNIFRDIFLGSRRNTLKILLDQSHKLIHPQLNFLPN